MFPNDIVVAKKLARQGIGIRNLISGSPVMPLIRKFIAMVCLNMGEEI